MSRDLSAGKLYVTIDETGTGEFIRLSLLFYDIITTLKVKNTFVIPVDSEVKPLVIKNIITEITDKLEITYSIKLRNFDVKINKFCLQFITDKGPLTSEIISLNNPERVR